MATQFRPISTNLTPVRIAGAGGVPILTLLVLLAIVFPIVRWVLILGAISGGAVAAALIRARRQRDGGPGGGGPRILFPEEADHANGTGSSVDGRVADARHSRRASRHRRLVPVPVMPVAVGDGL